MYRMYSNTLYCTVCSYSSSMKSNMNRHIKTKHSNVDLRVACEICAKIFKNRPSLKSHKRKCHPELQSISYLQIWGSRIWSKLLQMSLEELFMVVHFAPIEVSTRVQQIDMSKPGILRAPSGVNIARLCVLQETSLLNISVQIVTHLDLWSNKVQGFWFHLFTF